MLYEKTAFFMSLAKLLKKLLVIENHADVLKKGASPVISQTHP